MENNTNNNVVENKVKERLNNLTNNFDKNMENKMTDIWNEFDKKPVKTGAKALIILWIVKKVYNWFFGR